MIGARLSQRPGGFAAVLLLALGGTLWSVRAQAEEPSAPPQASKSAAGTAKKNDAARPAGAAARGASADGASTGSSSGATETIALEIVAKAPKPIPPVELDMLQLRLMLTDLKASFADEIDKALFRDPF